MSVVIGISIPAMTLSASFFPSSASIFALMACAAFTTSSQVVGGFSGSRPALRNASLLYHITAVEELNGIDAIRPSARL